MKIFIQVDGDCIGNNDNSDRDLICTIPRILAYMNESLVRYHTTTQLGRNDD